MNTTEFLDQLSVAVRRDAARQRRRRLVVVAAALATLVVAGGVAVAGTTDGWWGEVASENASVGIDLDLSTRATVARTGDATVEAVATNGGKGYCMTLFAGAKGMGTSCTTKSDSEFMTRADDTHWIGYGRILDDGAAALDMSGAGLPADVPLEHGGFFAFDIPRSEWHSLDGRTGDISILAADGSALRRACVFVGFAPGSSTAGDGSLGDAPGTCNALKPLVSKPELDKAKELVLLTLTHDQGIDRAGDTIALWTAPNRGGGTCWFMRTAGAAHEGGYSCGSSPTPPESPGLSSTLVGDHYANLVEGFVDPALGAVKAQLVGASRTLPVSFANGAVLAELPDSPRAGKEPGPVPGGPWRLVLYDAAGQEVKSQVLPAR